MRKTRRANQKRGKNFNTRRLTQQLSPATEGASKLSIGERMGGAIRRVRLERGLRLGDVTSAAGISVSMLSRFETGRSTAGLVLLERICAALGIDLSTLFSEIEQSRGDAQLIKATEQMEVVRPGTKHGHTYRLLSHRPRKSFEAFLINMDKRSRSYRTLSASGNGVHLYAEWEDALSLGRQELTSRAWRCNHVRCACPAWSRKALKQFHSVYHDDRICGIIVWPASNAVPGAQELSAGVGLVAAACAC